MEVFVVEVFNFLPDWAAQILAFAVAAIPLANVITAATPTQTDNKIWNIISRFLNILSLNVGKNKNADDKGVR